MPMLMPVIVTITGTDCQPHECASDDESPAAVRLAAAATVPASGSARAQWAAAAAGADLTGTVTLPLAVAAQSRSHWNIWRVLSPLSSGQPGRASGGGLWGLRLGSNTGEPVTLFIWRRVLSTLLSGQPGSVEGGVTGNR